MTGALRARMTPLRREVLRLLRRHGRAIAAYDLLSVYEHANRRQVTPHTIYRILEFLEQQGLVTRLHGQRRYVATEPSAVETKEKIYFVCSACGRTVECNEPKIMRAVCAAEEATALSR